MAEKLLRVRRNRDVALVADGDCGGSARKPIAGRSSGFVILQASTRTSEDVAAIFSLFLRPLLDEERTKGRGDTAEERGMLPNTRDLPGESMRLGEGLQEAGELG